MGCRQDFSSERQTLHRFLHLLNQCLSLQSAVSSVLSVATQHSPHSRGGIATTQTVSEHRSKQPFRALMRRLSSSQALFRIRMPICLMFKYQQGDEHCAVNSVQVIYPVGSHRFGLEGCAHPNYYFLRISEHTVEDSHDGLGWRTNKAAA